MALLGKNLKRARAIAPTVHIRKDMILQH
jgi:hypothetical protein